MKAFTITQALAERNANPRVPTPDELREASIRAQARLDHGDRGGAYLELWAVTGNPALMLQAQITTYSGTAGGLALEGNYRAKIANPEKYNLTLDKFSHEIDQAIINLAKKSAESGKPENFNNNSILEKDREVWSRHGMEDYFPGNAMWLGRNTEIAKTIGTVNAFLSGDESELGKRPEEYKDNPNYSIQHWGKDNRYTQVVDKQTGNTVVIFDKEFDSTELMKQNSWWSPSDQQLEQIKDEKPNARIQAEREIKMNFLVAGQLAPEDKLKPFASAKPVPVENVDRVFELDGKLYQYNDKKILEHSGVDFNKVSENHRRSGANFLRRLRDGADDITKVIEGKGDYKNNEVLRQKRFNEIVEKGLVTPLTESQTKDYKAMLDSLQYSPFQSPHQAFKNYHTHMLDNPISRDLLNNLPAEYLPIKNEPPIKPPNTEEALLDTKKSLAEIGGNLLDLVNRQHPADKKEVAVTQPTPTQIQIG